MSKNAKRIRTKYKDINIYFIITYDEEGDIYDIQASISDQDVNNKQDLLSSIDAICKLAGMCLRDGYYDAVYVAGELLSLSRGKDCLTSVIGDLILGEAET